MSKKTSGRELALLEESLYSYTGEDRVISSHELAEDLSKTEESTFIIKTHVPTLDRVLGGVEAGELIIVTGPTGEGKTTLLMTITANMCHDNIRSAWFTLEVTPRQFIKKMISATGDEKLPLFYVPRQNADNTVNWLIDRIIEAKVKYDVQAIYIDHIHMIFSLEKMAGNNLSLEIGDIVGKIKAIAIQYNLVVFLIAHSRDNTTTPNAEPKKEDIRDSGLIIRQADSILGVWRVPNDSSIKDTKRKEINEGDTWSKVKIFKNRRTGELSKFFMDHKEHKLIELDPFNGI